MPDVLERGVVLEVVTHHSVLRWGVGVPWRRAHDLLAIVVFVVQILLAHEVLGTFVLMRAAIL